MHIFVWKMWIPLLKLVHPYDRELFNEVHHSAAVLCPNMLNLSIAFLSFSLMLLFFFEFRLQVCFLML